MFKRSQFVQQVELINQEPKKRYFLIGVFTLGLAVFFVLLFILGTLLGVATYLTVRGLTPTAFYVLTGYLGLMAGVASAARGGRRKRRRPRPRRRGAEQFRASGLPRDKK